VNYYEFCLIRKKNKLVYITLNRTERRNAICEELARQLGEAWIKFRDDDEAWVAILRAAGNENFCVGMDMTESIPFPSDVKPYSTLILPSVHEVWKPIIAAISGYCVGVGLWLAIDCDLRISSEDAKFGALDVKWNLTDGFAHVLGRYLPPGIALEFLFTAELLRAQRLHDWGLVNKVVPRSEVVNEAVALANRICENGPGAIRQTKELFYRGMELSKDQGTSLFWHLYEKVTAQEDTREGFQAFKEKRKPEFKGR